MNTTRPATIELETRSARDVVDITERVGGLQGGAPDGSCHLFLRHTTAGLVLLTGEAGVPEDSMDILQSLVPSRTYWHDAAGTSRSRAAGSPSASSSGSC